MVDVFIRKGKKRKNSPFLRMDVHGGTGAPCRVHRLCAFSSIEHSSRQCEPHLAIIFGRVSAGPEETHEGRQACMHTSREKRRKRKRKKEMLRVRNLSECLSPQDGWTGCRSSSYVFIPFLTRGKREKRT